MRAYFFNNFYLSSIQQGIQAGHCAVDLLLKYAPPSNSGGHTSCHDVKQSIEDRRRTLWAYQWARDHKTFVVKNGGDDDTMQDLLLFMDDVDNPYPWVAFYEPGINSCPTCGDALTSICIILPEMVTAYAKEVRKGNPIPNDDALDDWRYKMITLLNSTGLAR